LATSVAGMTQDPNAFISQGIDIGIVDFVVTKSGNAFKMNFAGIAEPIVAATPGLSLHRPGTFKMQHARIYPDHAIANPTATVSFFPAGAMERQTLTLS
jgi:microcystin degradation protein MlrC